MNAHQERLVQSYRRVLGWFEANPSYLSAEPLEVARALMTQLDALRGIIARLTEYIALQETQLAQSLLVSKDEREQRREVLAHHMATITKTARALRGTVPGIGVLVMPKGNINTGELITAADVMARKADVYRSVLVENGLPGDFCEQLIAASGRLKSSLDARGLARGARRAAVQGIETELGLGRRVVDIMDASLKRVLRREPVKWAEWRHVQRVTQRGSMPKPAVNAVESGSIQPNGKQIAPSGSSTAPKAVPTPAQMVPTLVQQASSAPSQSPTEVVGSPTVQEKAA